MKKNLLKTLLLPVIGATMIQYQALATCITNTPVISNSNITYTPAPVSGNVVRCDGDLLTVSFTFDAGTAPNGHFTASLYAGTGVLLASATLPPGTTGYTFSKNMVQGVDPTGALAIVVEDVCGGSFYNDYNTSPIFLNINAAPVSKNLTGYSLPNELVCSTGGSYTFTLASGQFGVTYTLLLNNNLISGVSPISSGSFPAQSAYGIYTVKEKFTSSGCINYAKSAVNIAAKPTVPTASYKYCTSDNIFKAHATSSVSNGATISYTWKNVTTGYAPSATTSNDFNFATGPGNNDNVTVFATANGCSSATTTPPNAVLKSPVPAPYILFALYTDTLGNGHSISNPGLNSVPALKDNFSSANTWTLISDQVPAPGIPPQTTYQWYIIPGGTSTTIALSGKTSTSIQYLKNNLNEGVYHMEMTNTCNTASTGSVNIHFYYWGARKGYDAPYEATSSFIYPNPTSGDLNINSPYDNYTLSVINLMGSEVLSKQVNETSTKVDLSSLSAGTYVVKLVSAEGTVTKKVQVVK